MCKRWCRDFGDADKLFESKMIKPFVVLGQKEEYVQNARESWNIPLEILTDTTLTLANAINKSELSSVDISPSAWHPDKTDRPAVGFDPKHPEYDYPHGMTQPSILLLAKQSTEDASKTFASSKVLYSWTGVNHTPRPKPMEVSKFIVNLVEAHDTGKPLPEKIKNEKGYTMGHALCCGKRRIIPCVIQ